MMFLHVFYLFFLFVILPRSAARSRNVLDTPAGKAITRRRVYLMTMLSMFFVGVLTFMTAWRSDIELFPRRMLTLGDALVIVIALALKLTVGLVRLRTGQVLPRTQKLAPRTPVERILATLLIAQTAVVEECTYRGVAFTLLTWYTGNPWLAALLSAVAFGLAHLLQGGRAAIVAGLHGLSDQAVVAITGYLYPAMIVHFVYDWIFGAALARHAARTEATDAVTLGAPSVS